MSSNTFLTHTITLGKSDSAGSVTRNDSSVAHQCLDLHALLLAVRDLPPDRSLEVYSMLTLKHLLSTMHSAAPSPAVAAPTAAAVCKQHAMLSYCWGAKKDLGLRQKLGDKTGSRVLPAAAHNLLLSGLFHPLEFLRSCWPMMFVRY